jgi:hypothetical protein
MIKTGHDEITQRLLVCAPQGCAVLDSVIHQLFHPEVDPAEVPAYTSNDLIARTLAPGWSFTISGFDTWGSARLRKGNLTTMSWTAPSSALAVCAAALEARYLEQQQKMFERRNDGA